LTNIIGPRMRVKDERQTFIGSWIRAILRGKPFEVWGGTQKRDIVYIDDAVEAFLLASRMDAHGEAFNIGTEDNYSLLELADALVAANGRGEYQIEEFPPARRAIDIGDYCSDALKARTRLGWQPRVAVGEAFERTLAYYREHLDHYL
jgi:UDP-glucose 4-epimerase